MRLNTTGLTSFSTLPSEWWEKADLIISTHINFSTIGLGPLYVGIAGVIYVGSDKVRTPHILLPRSLTVHAGDWIHNGHAFSIHQFGNCFHQIVLWHTTSVLARSQSCRDRVPQHLVWHDLWAQRWYELYAAIPWLNVKYLSPQASCWLLARMNCIFVPVCFSDQPPAACCGQLTVLQAALSGCAEPSTTIKPLPLHLDVLIDKFSPLYAPQLRLRASFGCWLS